MKDFSKDEWGLVLAGGGGMGERFAGAVSRNRAIDD